MNRKKLLRRLAQGAVQNVPFDDFCGLVQSFGFSLARVSGSHHIFVHGELSELLNLQNVGGEAKPYQIRAGGTGGLSASVLELVHCLRPPAGGTGGQAASGTRAA